MIKIFFLLSTLFFTTSFSNAEASYVGDKTCASCHSTEVNEWKGSHHDLAMMIADKNSVKADFNNTTFNYNGIISTFYKKDGKFMVQTDGSDGKLHDYEIAYTFGVYPLQQYMIKFSDGNVQVLDPTWDSRSKADGGQRWYHIHKDDNVTAGDPLHWTGPNMNWNYMCADCHSTNLKKNYDVETKSYHTTYDSINVSCEACHGPASEHLSWSQNQDSNVSGKGFTHNFKTSTKPWRERTDTLKSFIQEEELNVCAKCHSRRSQLDDDYKPGNKFNNHYLATMLEQNLYFPDGKIQDEVYVYDSFLQSEMYAQGVTCTDCHNPHTLERKADGDKVCFSCHQSDTYTLTAHHKHKVGSTGSSCISCHMPARTYMGVDSRNDHSFRVPRPDVSVEMKDVPNACNLCHTDKDASWAADAMKSWYGKTPVGKQNFAHDMQALRTNKAEAPKSLYNILLSSAPDITKATVAEYLGNYPSKQTYTTTLQMLMKSDPMIRRTALQALEAFPPKMRMKKTFEMLDDPIKIVRMEAARQLSIFPLGQVNAQMKDKLKKSFDEYENVLLFTAERPETQVSLALFYTNLKMFAKVEKAYLEAIRLQVQFVPAYINYSTFLVSQGKEKEAFSILQKGLANVPHIAILHHALGLWYIRNKEFSKAILALEKAATLDENNARFTYVYAVSIGEKQPKKAISILEEAYKRHTGDMQIVSGLVYYTKQVGEVDKSKYYEEKLKNLQNFSVR